MNRFLIILCVLLVVVSAVVGAVFYLSLQPASTQPPNTTTYTTPAGSQPGTVSVIVPPGRSKEAVAATVRSQIAPGEPTTVQGTVIVGDYALQVWENIVGGGQALLKYDAAKDGWDFVSWGGGAWTVEGLVEEGIPQNIATSLVANLPSAQ